MVPMRTGRVVAAFVFVVLVIAGIDFLVDISTSDRATHTLWSTLLTAALIASYTWLAPFAMPFLAKPTVNGTAIAKQAQESLNGLSSFARSKPRLFVIDDSRPVAYGLGVPGCAAIFVTTGLMSTMSPGALRFVLAHELEHINQRHALATSLIFAVMYCGKMLLTIPPSLGPFAFLGYLAVMRACERAADKGASKVVGSETTKDALLELKQIVGEKGTPSRLLDLLSTHPSFGRRAARF